MKNLKRLMSILLAVLLCVSMAVPALAEEEGFPEPEGGKKFDGSWAIPGGRIDITYEEEGYRVYIITFDQQSAGGIWEYSCTWQEDTGVLESISSSHHTYAFDPETNDMIHAEPEYEDIDEAGQSAVFAIGENGKLTWQDPRGNAGEGLEFVSIGSFEGVWRNEEAKVWAEIMWNGMTAETFNYTVFLHGEENGEQVDLTLEGSYDPETGKLACEGIRTLWEPNGEGGFDPHDDGELYSAVLTQTGDGVLHCECGETSVDLTYDLLADGGSF